IGQDPGKATASQRSEYDGATDRRRSFPAIVDTGAMVSIFPRHVWTEFEPEITRLEIDPAELEARPFDKRTPLGVILGRKYPYLLGRIWLGAYDLEGRRMPATRVLAMFREDDIPPTEPQPPVVLGLRYGILDNRQFFREPVFAKADLYEPR